MSPEGKASIHINAKGVYNPGSGPAVVVKTPEDLVRHGLCVSVDAVAATWGEEAAARYSSAMQQRHTFVTEASDLSSAVHFHAAR